MKEQNKEQDDDDRKEDEEDRSKYGHVLYLITSYQEEDDNSTFEILGLLKMG